MGALLNAMSTAYGIFDGASRVLVANMFRDVLSILSAFCAYAGLEMFGVAVMMFLMLTVVDFLWSTSSEGRFRFSKGPVRWASIFKLSTGA